AGLVAWKWSEAIWQREEARGHERDAREQEREARRQLLQARVARYALQLETGRAALESGYFTRAAGVLADCEPDRRGWAHGYLPGRAGRATSSWPLPAQTSSLARSRDGRWVAVGGERRIFLLDVRAGTPVREIPCGAGGYVSGLAFHPGGGKLYAAAGGGVH